MLGIYLFPIVIFQFTFNIAYALLACSYCLKVHLKTLAIILIIFQVKISTKIYYKGSAALYMNILVRIIIKNCMKWSRKWVKILHSECFRRDNEISPTASSAFASETFICIKIQLFTVVLRARGTGGKHFVLSVLLYFCSALSRHLRFIHQQTRH